MAVFHAKSAVNAFRRINDVGFLNATSDGADRTVVHTKRTALALVGVDFKNKKSVAMNFTFSSLERTLTDDEIATEMAKILSALKRKVGAKIR